ncbi:MAG: hypothetical protein QG583_715 [Patescibacteria group bacterium]|nr:hypothetical protein [Patescibacteria group bacterium]
MIGQEPKRQSTPIKKEDTYLHLYSKELAPHANFFIKALEVEDRDWLLSLDVKEQTDIENCLQNLSDQRSTFTTMDDDELKKSIFDVSGLLWLTKLYSEKEGIVLFLIKKVLLLVEQESRLLGIKTNLIKKVKEMENDSRTEEEKEDDEKLAEEFFSRVGLSKKDSDRRDSKDSMNIDFN